MKATFFERLGAYVLDTIIVSLIFSLITLGFGSYTSSTEKLMEELDNKLINAEITNQEYLEEYQELLYDYQKENVFQTGISLALTIAYYVVFQYMNKGQTIGKKLLGIKVVDKNTKEPVTILKGLLRSLLICSIISTTVGIIAIYIVGKENYFMVYTPFLMLEMIFLLITIMFVLYKKDGRGLHDIMASTMVIKESR